MTLFEKRLSQKKCLKRNDMAISSDEVTAASVIEELHVRLL